MQLDADIVKLKDEEKSLTDTLHSQRGSLDKLRNMLTLDDLKSKHDEVSQILKEKKEQLSKMETSTEKLDPKLIENLNKKLKTVKEIWRDRNNTCMDVVDQFMDAMGKKESQVYEIMGMETDHDAGGLTYKEFCKKIKEKNR